MNTVEQLKYFYQESRTPAVIDEKTINIAPASERASKIGRIKMLIVAIVMILVSLLLKAQDVKEGFIVCGIIGLMCLGLFFYMTKVLNTAYIIDKVSGKVYSKYKNSPVKELGNISDISQIYEFDNRSKGAYVDTSVFIKPPNKNVKIARYYDPAVSKEFREGFNNSIRSWLNS